VPAQGFGREGARSRLAGHTADVYGDVLHTGHGGAPLSWVLVGHR